MEHHDGTEQMPHLEPLNAPNSETNDLDLDHAAVASRLQQLGGPTVQKPNHDIRWYMEDALEPLRLRLVLENKGNVARDHLASERTYLAYVRTSLACASAGVALVQLFSLSTQQGGVDLTRYAKPIGATTILFGLVILVFGLVRYFTTQSALVRGYFPVARHSMTAIALVLGSLVGVVFGTILATR